jgi:hypothetical protein
MWLTRLAFQPAKGWHVHYSYLHFKVYTPGSTGFCLSLIYFLYGKGIPKMKKVIWGGSCHICPLGSNYISWRMEQRNLSMNPSSISSRSQVVILGLLQKFMVIQSDYIWKEGSSSFLPARGLVMLSTSLSLFPGLCPHANWMVSTF